MAPHAEIRTQGLIPGKHTLIRARDIKGREGTEEHLEEEDVIEAGEAFGKGRERRELITAVPTQ